MTLWAVTLYKKNYGATPSHTTTRMYHWSRVKRKTARSGFTRNGRQSNTTVYFRNSTRMFTRGAWKWVGPTSTTTADKANNAISPALYHVNTFLWDILLDACHTRTCFLRSAYIYNTANVRSEEFIVCC